MLDLAPITEAYRTGRIEPHHVAALLTEVDRLQSGGCARDQRTTQFCAEAVAKDAEVARLTSELAAAQAGPVVEWRKAEQWEEVDIGRFSIAVSDAGWSVEIKGHSGMYELIDRGPETGPAGKAAAEAAYRRACGFPGRALPSRAMGVA